MPLTILNVANPFSPVSADAVGGAEQIVALLDEGLARAGHRSIMIACEGSKSAGTLISVPRETGPIDNAVLECAWQAQAEAIKHVLDDSTVDVIHFHDLDFHRYLPDGDVPMLATLHLPTECYAPEIFERRNSTLFLQCVSASQRSRCPDEPHVLDDNPYGIALDRFKLNDQKDDYALMLGRVCPEKGFDHALRAARDIDVPLIIAGQVFPYAAHQRYFESEVQPLLDERRCFIGAVDFERKRRLLEKARCVLIPSRVAESSSLVAMEALACGTPVIAYRSGALVDIVDHGRTGFLVNDEREMAEAIANTHTISPAECRKQAEARFSANDMVQRQVKVYQRLHALANFAKISAVSTRLREQYRPRLGYQQISSPEELESLQTQWSKLYERCSSATPFQTPEWLLAWRRHFSATQLTSLALWDTGRLIGLAPCHVPLYYGGRTLTQLGTSVSDYQDVLIARDDMPRGIRGLQTWLELREDWEICNFENLRDGSPLLKLNLDEMAESRVNVQQVCPELRASNEGNIVIPSHFENKLEQAQRALQRLGQVRFVSADETTVDSFMAALIALHCKQWEERQLPGVLADIHVQLFHAEVARAFYRRGILRLYALQLDGEIMAVFYGFADKGRTHFYLSGFDPAFAKYSPGALVVRHAIQEAGRERSSVFDFLRGEELHKHRWGAEKTVTRQMVLTRDATRQSVPASRGMERGSRRVATTSGFSGLR